jgi:DNA-binding NarL/FixJ family response regulator
MSSLKILLVDDSPAFLDSAANYLAKHKRVTVIGKARSAAEGLKLAKELAPDLILLDLTMPRMNGIEVTRRLKNGRTAAQIVILTLQKGSAYKTAALEAGADGFIAKDDLGTELPGLIDSMLKQPVETATKAA